MSGVLRNHTNLFSKFFFQKRLKRSIISSYLSTTPTLTKKEPPVLTKIDSILCEDENVRKTELVELTPKNIKGEFHKLREELSKRLIFNHPEFQIRHPKHTVDMVFTFEEPDILKKFMVQCDTQSGKGHSYASFEITSDKTALFTGEIRSSKITSGTHSPNAYAIVITKSMLRSFNRKFKFNWKMYSHLVLKVRGDGRTYTVTLPQDEGKYDIAQHIQYSYPLYTRGGPYWQITKIPLSHFYCVYKGSLVDDQGEYTVHDKISKFGITLSDGNDGPFRLEIDYVGLERDVLHNPICPYEGYYFGRYMTQ